MVDFAKCQFRDIIKYKQHPMKLKMPKGKLIVIDGIDGAGKATQTKLLLEKIKQTGKDAQTLDFPQYYDNFFGKLIGRFLNNEFGDAPKINPYLASVLYAADRFESQGKISAWLEDGKIVILDRYVSSNQIHQGGKIHDVKEKEIFLEWLEKMEFEVFKIPKPDAIIFLNVPYDYSKNLLKKKTARNYIKKAKNDKVEKNKQYQMSSYFQSLELVKRNNNWLEINCIKNNELLPPDKISDSIWNKLRKII